MKLDYSSFLLLLSFACISSSADASVRGRKTVSDENVRALKMSRKAVSSDEDIQDIDPDNEDDVQGASEVDGAATLNAEDEPASRSCPVVNPMYSFNYDNKVFNNIPFHSTVEVPGMGCQAYPPDAFPGQVWTDTLQTYGVVPDFLNINYAGKCARRQNRAFLAEEPTTGPGICTVEVGAQPGPQLSVALNNLDKIPLTTIDALFASLGGGGGGGDNNSTEVEGADTEVARQAGGACTVEPSRVSQEAAENQISLFQGLGALIGMPADEVNRTIAELTGCLTEYQMESGGLTIDIVQTLDVLTRCAFQDSADFGANAPSDMENFNPGFNNSFYQAISPPNRPPQAVIDSFFNGTDDVVGMNWMANDDMFGYMRLTGPAPDVIRKATIEDVGLDSFPVTDEMWQTVMDTPSTLNESVAEGEVYILDYSILAPYEGITSDNPDQILFSPKALFGISEEDVLTVVAIQVYSDPAHEDNDVLTPPQQRNWEEATPSEKVDLLKWSLAKVAVNSAEASYFELVTHLGLTHLVMEPFIVTSKRNLPTDHPISMLLESHIWGTININDEAEKILMAPDHTIDWSFPPPIEVSQDIATGAVRDFLGDINNRTFPMRMAKNDVEDIPDYPYYDDGMLEWEAMSDFVESFLEVLYEDDEAVATDDVLSCWANDMEENGMMDNFGTDGSNEFTTIEGLRDFLTLFMFTGSCQHSATNYAQGVYVLFTPMMPLSGYANPNDVTEDNLEMMAKYQGLPKDRWIAFDGLNVLFLLQSMNMNKLGQYVTDVNGTTQELFEGDYLKAVEGYRRELVKIGEEIDERNSDKETLRGSLLPYELLHPKFVPSSIHI